MKALVYEGNKTLTYKTVPPPEVREGEVLVKVDSVGICGSDMHAYLGHDERRPPPLILGHEAAGIVCDETGENSEPRRVTVNPLVVCQQCQPCLSGKTNLCVNRQIISMPPRQGAFAQYIAMPERNLITVPAEVPLSKAALAEPIACGWHAVRLAQQTLNRPLSECHCLVLGGGAIGVGVATVLAAQGGQAVHLVEPNPLRRQALQKSDLWQVHDSSENLLAKLGKAAISLVIDAVGISKTREAACRVVAPGGVIAHIGLGDNAGGINVRRLTLQEITFIGVYTYTAADFQATSDAIFSGQLGELDWISERPLSEGGQCFTDLLQGQIATAKIILKTEI